MIFAFIGVIIIGLSGGEPEGKETLHESSSSQSMLMLGVLFAIIAALSQSVIAVTSRVLKQVNFSAIMFNYGVMQALI